MLAQSTTVKGAIFIKYLRTEALSNSVEPRSAGLYHLARDNVSINNVNPEV